MTCFQLFLLQPLHFMLVLNHSISRIPIDNRLREHTGFRCVRRSLPSDDQFTQLSSTHSARLFRNLIAFFHPIETVEFQTLRTGTTCCWHDDVLVEVLEEDTLAFFVSGKCELDELIETEKEFNG
ncbi:hypothetical protein GCK72_004256 [Caenorhabditis remanei]|uniref:DUF38 domain-containing protein n=1 Tax=Caenorhabditis remanei TaxID=31234 RepID=A0A6A5HB79_CAERE|nr:hypothetical protein GCK72_004256 [Caenorhabditis remanei]KAF1764309.1 hypothetical protein GCK72_004256 [Caenorhabditis remanei]